MIFCVKAYFSSPTVARVLVYLRVKRPGSPTYFPERIKEAFLRNPGAPPTEENPWVAEFERSGIDTDGSRAIFDIVALNANGTTVGARSAPLPPRRRGP